MTKDIFNVGDKVVCVNASLRPREHTLIKDFVYTVTNVSNFGLVAVKDKNGDQARWLGSPSIHFYSNRFRLAETMNNKIIIETNKNWGLF